MMQRASGFKCYFTCEAQKIIIYRDFNLISNFLVKSKIATIIGDVTGLQQRHHPLKMNLFLLSRSKAFH